MCAEEGTCCWCQGRLFISAANMTCVIGMVLARRQLSACRSSALAQHLYRSEL